MEGAPHLSPPGFVGPNAVIQLAHALESRLGPEAAARHFTRFGLRRLLDHPPAEMIEEGVAATLLGGLWQALPAAEAHAIASDAGARTADYIIANRIPAPVRWALAALPQGPAARLLLTAIHRNAWTFAGSGLCTVEWRPGLALSIKGNPLALPGGAWHAAVLERLFQRLAAPRARVRHRSCCRDGAPACRFEIELT